MTKRILLLLTDLEIGGAPILARNLACRLAATGFEVAVACLAAEGPIAAELRNAHIPTFALGARNACDLRVIPRLAVLFRRYRPHVLHCFCLHANIMGRLVGTAMAVPHIIASLHTCQPLPAWHHYAENLTCRLSRFTVCVSPSVARQTRQRSHVPLSRIRIIPNGIDFERFAIAAPHPLTSLGLDPHKRTVIFVGRLDPVKHIDDLLTACVSLIADMHLQILIVGDGPERVRLEKLSSQLGIAPDTHFLGPRRDIPSLLRAADVFVLPSLYEGMPCAVLEAMAAGIPIVASRAPGIVDILTHDRTALLVPPADPPTLQTALVTLLTDLACAQRLTTAARDHVRQNFTLDAMLDAYISLYRVP